MADLLKKCEKCAKYTLLEKCSCGGEAFSSHPPKYSVGDKYASYRRKEKYG